jgi:excinuclease UvrABC ATPase subunit
MPLTQAFDFAVNKSDFQRQRPCVPGIRSIFGTGTELLNSLHLMFSRLASHRCSYNRWYS